MGLLDDKVAIVHGGGRGLGRIQALALARQGARVVVRDAGHDGDGGRRGEERARAVVDEIHGAGGVALADCSDLSDRTGAAAVVRKAVDSFGRLDAVLHSPSAFIDSSTSRLDLDRLDALFALKVRSALHLIQQSSDALTERGGAMVMAVSRAAFFGTQRRVAEGVVDGALIGVVRSTAAEMIRRGIRLNAVAATLADDNAAQGARTAPMPSPPPGHGQETPARAVPTAGNLSRAVTVFLVSDLSRHVHGEIIGIDGGHVYALVGRETTGIILAGDPTAEDVAEALPTITRDGHIRPGPSD